MRSDRATVSARAGQGRASGLKAGASGASGIAARILGTVVSAAKRRPGVVVAVLAVTGCGGAIGWNALTQQANKHPAPLFAPKSAAKAEPARRPETVAAAAAPAPIPAPPPARRPDAAALAAAPAPEVFVRAAAPGSDPIGAMIRGAEPGARPSEPKPDARVASVQKALTKLGYGPLRSDGFLGETTRKAIERFEREHSLPVTGGLGTKTLRQLASASGTPIE